MKRLLTLAALLLPALARAETGAPPPACLRPAEARPLAGTTLPANTPALVFEPPSYPYAGNKPITAYNLGLEEVGGEVVPIQVDRLSAIGQVAGYETGNYDRYLVKLQRALSPGLDVVLGFDDDCGSIYGGPLGPPVRNQRFRYKVGPAQPLPTKIGTPKQASFGIDPMTCGLQRIDFEIALDPALAAFPLVRMEARGPDGRLLSAGFSRMQPNVVQGSLLASCGPAADTTGYLRRGESTITLGAELLGGAPLPAVTLAVQFDCATDAGCAGQDAGPDGSPPALDAAPDRVWPAEGDPPLPVGNAFEDSPAVDAGGPGMAGAGCSCSVDRRVSPSGPGLAAALLALTWVRRRRTASRTRPGRPGRCTPSGG